MTPRAIRAQIVRERIASIRRMLDALGRLPASDFEAFVADEHTPAAAESYLRRALEAVFDLGRHVLPKGFRRVTAVLST